MGERKVLNKYFPPDFDPKLVPRTKWDPFKQIETRMMIPFNIQCNSCGEFMYRGTKFNMRKEDVFGDDYKGVRKFRFYMKCALCNREITFITDPQNMDYAMENGAKRLFEVWKEQDKVEQEAIQKREDEEKADAMKALEHRTIDSKLEMDIMDALEETKAMSGKRDAIKPDHILAMRAQEDAGEKNDEEDELESEVKAAFQQQKKMLRRLDDSDEEEETSGSTAGNGLPSKDISSSSDPLAAKEASKPPVISLAKPAVTVKPVINVKVKKRKAEGESKGKGATGAAVAPKAKKAVTGEASNGDKVGSAAPPTAPPPPASMGLGGLCAYGSSDED